MRKLESQASVPPLDRLRQLSGIVVRLSSSVLENFSQPVEKLLSKLLSVAESLSETEEFEVVELLMTDTQSYANEQSLVLEASATEWLIYPQCSSIEEAMALCPQIGDRILLNGQIGTVNKYDFADGLMGATVLWDDGSVTEENGFLLEQLPPILALMSVGEQESEIEVLEDKEDEDELLASFPPQSMKLPLGLHEVSVANLRSHPINSQIYGEDEDDSALEEMIQGSGWIKTLLVTPDGDVVGGNRRLRIAQRKSIEKLKVEVREFANDEAVLEALLLDNAVREKTVEQKVREARFWLPIESEKAKSRKGRSENQENFPGGQARDIVAARVGLGSGKNFQKADKVVTIVDSLKESDPVKSQELRDFLNNQSVHAAYMAACNDQEKPSQWTPKIGERVIVSFAAEHHAGVSGTVKSKGSSAPIVSFDQPSEGINEDFVYLSLLLPADPVAAAAVLAKQKEAAAKKNPERSFGLRKQKDGGLLPEKVRNEGFDLNAVPVALSLDKTADTFPNNVINLPTRSAEPDEQEKGVDVVALEIAKGIRYLSPEALSWALNWACNDTSNPLKDEHLHAIANTVQYVLNKRHPEDIAN